MHVLTNKKAISTLTLVILLLCSAVFGAVVSYLLVMANYYNMPENVALVVENIDFPADTVKYFSITVLNPSNAASDVNITAIHVNVKGKNEVYSVKTTEPEEFPIKVERGTRKNIRCIELAGVGNWGKIAGETITVELEAGNASTQSLPCRVPKVKLELKPTFNETISIEYFNLTVKNIEDSIMNLTISDVQVDWQSIKENVAPLNETSPVLAPGQNITFVCHWSWDWTKAGGKNFTITVVTAEGYEASCSTGELPGVRLSIEEIKLDYAAPFYYVDLTVKSSEGSTLNATINKVSFSILNKTFTSGENFSTWVHELDRPLEWEPVKISPNQSLSIRCYWNWHNESYAGKAFTVNVYTEEGFTVPGKTAEVYPAVVWEITRVGFDLDNLNNFTVSVKNMVYSLYHINVTKILFNDVEVGRTPLFGRLDLGGEGKFNCSIQGGWGAYRGENVNITAIAYVIGTDEELRISKVFNVPAVGLKLLGDNINELLGNLTDPNSGITIPYINVTISNSANSLRNVTITKIVIEGNGTYEVDGSLSNPKFAPNGYVLQKGETVTVVGLCNYMLYFPTQGNITVTVFTAEGFQTSRTWSVP